VNEFELLYSVIRDLQTEVKNLQARIDRQDNRLSYLQATVNADSSEDDLSAMQMVAHWHPDCCSVADYLEYDYGEERRVAD
jgi:hypothetical protein